MFFLLKRNKSLVKTYCFSYYCILLIKKHDLVLKWCSNNGLEYTSITPEKEYDVNITEVKRRLHFNRDNYFLYGNKVKMHQFKSKQCKISVFV